AYNHRRAGDDRLGYGLWPYAAIIRLAINFCGLYSSNSSLDVAEDLHRVGRRLPRGQSVSRCLPGVGAVRLDLLHSLHSTLGVDSCGRDLMSGRHGLFASASMLER